VAAPGRVLPDAALGAEALVLSTPVQRPTVASCPFPPVASVGFRAARAWSIVTLPVEFDHQPTSENLSRRWGKPQK
jgi:hypothetical protein